MSWPDTSSAQAKIAAPPKGARRLRAGTSAATTKRKRTAIPAIARVLYGALPSIRRRPLRLTQDEAVLPAVYNRLKADFEACCLPYSQAIDVSRTYLRSFKSCRFEEIAHLP